MLLSFLLFLKGVVPRKNRFSKNYVIGISIQKYISTKNFSPKKQFLPFQIKVKSLYYFQNENAR